MGTTTVARPGVPSRAARGRAGRVVGALSTRRGLLVAGFVLVPFVVATVSVVGRRWYPTTDWTFLELFTRDVGGAHTPLVGPYSRYGWSHPGPLLFYLLAVPYRLTGGSSIGLLVGSALINLLGAAGALVVARRRGGTRLVVLVSIGMLLLVRAAGGSFLRDPWNPYVTVLPFLWFLLLVWDLSCGRTSCLPLAVGVGSFLVETHVGYAAPVVVGLAWGGGWVAVERRRRRAPDDSLARSLRWSGVVAAVLWLPPLVQELQHRPGNLSEIVRFFASHDATVGLTRAVRILGVELGGWAPWLGRAEPSAYGRPPVPVPVGLLLLGLGGFVAWRRGATETLKLVGLTFVVLVTALVSVSHVVDAPAWYLLRWIWPVALLAWLTGVWAVVEAAPRMPSWSARAIGAVGVAALLVLGAAVTVDAATAPVPWAGRSAVIESMLPGALRAVRGQPGPIVIVGAGDAFRWGFAQSGLQLALERHGVRTLVPRYDETTELRFGEQRVAPNPGGTELLVAVDDSIARIRARPDVSLVASYDPLHHYFSTRSADERSVLAEFARQLRRFTSRPYDSYGKVDLVPVARALEAMPDPHRRALAQRVLSAAPRDFPRVALFRVY